MSKYCASLDCFNCLCHETRSLCVKCDINYTEHCDCHCDCYTKIVLNTFYSGLWTIILENREFSHKESSLYGDRSFHRGKLHPPLERDKFVFEERAKPILRDLEKQLREFNTIGEITAFASLVLGDSFKPRVLKCESVAVAKITILSQFMTMIYTSDTGDFRYFGFTETQYKSQIR